LENTKEQSATIVHEAQGERLDTDT